MPRMIDLVCPDGHEQIDVRAAYGQNPACPVCGQATVTLWKSSFPAVIDDTCDFTVEHMASEPIHFTSKQEHRRMCKQLGLRVKDRHVGTQGSDKSPLTRRWI